MGVGQTAPTELVLASIPGRTQVPSAAVQFVADALAGKVTLSPGGLGGHYRG